jgi:hypothetical protein
MRPASSFAKAARREFPAPALGFAGAAFPALGYAGVGFTVPRPTAFPAGFAALFPVFTVPAAGFFPPPEFFTIFSLPIKITGQGRCLVPPCP